MISVKHRGSFKKTTVFLKNSNNISFKSILEKYGRAGVLALSNATPKDSGKTASSWEYRIDIANGSATISWINTNENNGVNIALILQYGHGTRNGGYVRGIDYINPAMKPIFDELANQVWEEVTSK